MQRHIITLSLFATAALLVATAIGCGGKSAAGGVLNGGQAKDESEVRALIARQMKLFQQENWRELYQTYSPRFREDCSYNDFLDGASSASLLGFDPGEADIDELDVRIEGTTAYATYIQTYEGQDIEAVTEDDPDLYVKIDGKWYDEVDSHTECD
jgi:hypothetical protein